MSGVDTSRAIVIADGLTREFLSPDHPYRSSHENVGDREIERLVGRGKAHGDGPLVAFLEAVAGDTVRTGVPGRILLTPGSAEEPGEADLAPGSGVIDPLEPLMDDAVVVSAAGGVVPAEALAAALAGMGIDHGSASFPTVP